MKRTGKQGQTTFFRNLWMLPIGSILTIGSLVSMPGTPGRNVVCP
jgi:hypothetical protein